MKHKLILLISIGVIISCQKKNTVEEPPHPVMRYQDFQDQTISLSDPPLFIDIDNNGADNLILSVNVSFNPSTGVTEKRADIICIAGTYIPIMSGTQAPILNYGDKISINEFAGYSWYNAWRAILASKQLSPQPGDWIGNWNNKTHKYIPFLLDPSGIVRYGWIELSFDSATEKITVHKTGIVFPSGIVTEYKKPIKAGY
jgi:hypothetical protein